MGRGAEGKSPQDDVARKGEKGSLPLYWEGVITEGGGMKDPLTPWGKRNSFLRKRRTGKRLSIFMATAYSGGGGTSSAALSLPPSFVKKAMGKEERKREGPSSAFKCVEKGGRKKRPLHPFGPF